MTCHECKKPISKDETAIDFVRHEDGFNAYFHIPCLIKFEKRGGVTTDTVYQN